MAIKAEDLVRKAKEFIEYKKDKNTKIAYLTLNRPDHYNATTIGMRLLYGDLIHRANIDDNVKVLVIRGAGDHFGTGGDLDEQNDAYTEGADASLLHEFEIDDPDVQYPTKDAFRYIHGLCEHYTKARGGCRSLQEFKKISIVEAKGYCYGWHFYQAADADLVIASEDALFGHPAFRYVGWGPRMWAWAMMMGLRKFQEMVFTGRPFTASEMYECNFVNSVVARKDLEEEVAKYAKACSLSRPVDAVVMQKTFFQMMKQYQGEYMGSIMSAMLESMGGAVKPDRQDLMLGKDVYESGLGQAVKVNDNQFPPEFRLSKSGRRKAE
jgi:enoyl-CoA hydratase